MMDNLRSAASSLGFKILLVVIILSFLFTGVGGYLFSDSQQNVAKVNGEPILTTEFERAFQMARSDLEGRFGREVFDQLIENQEISKGMRQNVLKELIDQKLIDQYLKNLKLTASNESVKTYIRNIDRFSDGNGFNNDLYLQYLRENRVTPDQFAENVRQALIKEQLVNIYTSSDFILPKESQEQMRLEMQERKIRTLTFDEKSIISEQIVNQEEIERYYQQNRAGFTVLEKIKLDYLMIEASQVKNSVTVTNEDLEKYYEENKQQYYRPATYGFDMMEVVSKEDAKAIIAELKAGADFGKTAKAKSKDPAVKYTDGRLGITPEKALTDEMKAANLKTVGEISEPIATVKGYLIMKLYHFQPEGIIQLADIKTRLEREVREEKELLAFYQLQQKIGNAIQAGSSSLASIAKEVNLPLRTTALVERTALTEPFNSKEMEESVFEQTMLPNSEQLAQISTVLSVDKDRAIVYQVKEYIPAITKPLEEVRPQVIDAIKQNKAKIAIWEKARRLLNELQSGQPETILAAEKLQFGTQQSVSRQTAITKNIFDVVKTEGKTAYGVGENDKGEIILFAVDVIEEGKTLSDEELQNYLMRLSSEKARSNFNSLLISLRQQAKIEINEIF